MIGIKEAIALWEEENNGEYVVASAARWNEGVLIAPMMAKTHETLTGCYSYVTPDHTVHHCVSLNPEVTLKLVWIPFEKSAIESLLELVDEADELFDNQDECKTYVLSKAPDYLKEFLKTSYGQSEFDAYTSDAPEDDTDDDEDDGPDDSEDEEPFDDEIDDESPDDEPFDDEI